MYKLMEPPASESYPQTSGPGTSGTVLLLIGSLLMTTFYNFGWPRRAYNLRPRGTHVDDTNKVLDTHPRGSGCDVCVRFRRAPTVVGARLSVDRAHLRSRQDMQAHIFLTGEATYLMRKVTVNAVMPVGWPPLGETLQKVVAIHIPIFS